MRIETPYETLAPWPSRAARWLFKRQSRPPRETDSIVTAFRDGEVTLRENRRVEGFTNALAEHGYQGIRAGDLVIHSMDGFAGAIGVSDSDGKASPVVHCYQPSENVEPRFYAYLLRDAARSGFITSLARGIRERSTAFDSETFQSLVLPLPPLTVQQAIADFLDAETARIDALIAKKRQLVAKLRERRLMTMIQGVTGQLLSDGKLIDSGLPWLTHRPGHWGEPLLRLVAQLGSGHTPSRSRPEWWTGCTFAWITTGEVAQMREDRIEYVTETREKISELGMANSSAELHPAGTVVLSRTASAGFSAIMGADMATSQDFVTWTCGPLLEPRYLLLCLRAMRPDLLGRLAQGSTHKTIYMPDIESIRIPLPPLDEQRSIVEAVWRSLGRIDEIIGLLDRQIELLAEHRQALITAAVTGQMEVTGVAVSRDSG